MTKTLKALSALLSYPTQELREATDELRAAIRHEGLLSAEALTAVEALISAVAATDLYDLQERYVDLFDRGRALSLHLFEHVHGESRDRGQAMSDLKSLYDKQGLIVTKGELPDFLPLLLEFLSTRPLAEGQALLGQASHILAALAQRLRKRNSPYEAVFRAVGELASAPSDAPEAQQVAEPPDASAADPFALDAQWQEEPVTFGPEAAPGCKDQLIARIRAARRPAPGLVR